MAGMPGNKQKNAENMQKNAKNMQKQSTEYARTSKNMQMYA